MATSLSLKNILVPSKAIDVEYPGMPGFKVSVAYLSREVLLKIRKNTTKSVFKGRQVVEEPNDEAFLEQYVEAAIKGWSGFKLRYVEQLVPVDISAQDKDEELEYSKENALMLMKNSSDFDNYITSVVSDLGKFSKSS